MQFNPKECLEQKSFSIDGQNYDGYPFKLSRFENIVIIDIVVPSMRRRGTQHLNKYFKYKTMMDATNQFRNFYNDILDSDLKQLKCNYALGEQ